MKKLILILLLVSAPAAGQILKDTKTAAMRYGAEAGRLAGGGYFCQFEEEDLDLFIGLSRAKLLELALDKTDRIVAQLEFSNNYSAWAAREPEEGCEEFRQEFYQVYNDLL